jgi:hypothetical protein
MDNLALQTYSQATVVNLYESLLLNNDPNKLEQSEDVIKTFIDAINQSEASCLHDICLSSDDLLFLNEYRRIAKVGGRKYPICLHRIARSSDPTSSLSDNGRQRHSHNLYDRGGRLRPDLHILL